MSRNNNNTASTSSILRKYSIFDSLDTQLIENIKLFYINRKYYEEDIISEALFATNCYHVFSYNSYEKQIKLIDELCDKRVTKFDSGDDYYMALTECGTVYSWGYNTFGQLGNGTDVKCFEPKPIHALPAFQVKDICCGRWHSIILTKGNEVFAFGCNYYGQIGNSSTEKQLFPVRLNSFISAKVCAVSCNFSHSLALTECGKVFVWGSNSWGQLGIGDIKKTVTPVQLGLHCCSSIKQITCGPNYSMLLSNDGDLYFCGYISDTLCHVLPTKINKFLRFNKIASLKYINLCVSVSAGDKCFVFGQYVRHKSSKGIFSEFTETNLKSVDEIFAYYEQTTHKTIAIKAAKSVIQEEVITDNESESALKQRNKYRTNFCEMYSLGIGAFSTVFKCEHRRDNKCYAVKKVSFCGENFDTVSKELKILSYLRSEYVVNYVDSWVEDNYYINSYGFPNSANNLSSSNLLYDPHKPLLLHIQMDLCALTLKEAINEIKECSTFGCLSPLGYYISSTLFIELLECVEYLHKQKPAIIHRDLKPENILLSFSSERCVKLSDFGLSTFHEFADQSHTKYIGTKNYRAPEVHNTGKYTTKADIYSVGIIAQELFIVDITSDRNLCCDLALKSKIKRISNLIAKTLNPKSKLRPSCAQMLASKHLWAMSEQTITVDNQFNEVCAKTPKSNCFGDNFVEYFIQNRFK